VKSNEKMTPLLLAAKKGHIFSLKTLLKLKSNLYAVDQWKWTALHHAAFNCMKSFSDIFISLFLR